MLTLDRIHLPQNAPNQVPKKDTDENVLHVVGDDNVRNGLPNDLWFYIRTYRDILSEDRYSDPTMPHGKYYVILTPAIELLNTLTIEEQRHIYKCYHDAKRLLETINTDNSIDILHKIGDMWSNMIQRIQLDQKAVDYVRTSNIPIPEESRKSTEKSYHKKEMTFYYDDYVYSIAISTIIKLLIPILGDAVTRCYQSVNIKTHAKETYASIILHTIFQNSPVLVDAYKKLENYVFPTVLKAEKDKFTTSKRNNAANAYTLDQTRFSYIMNGYTQDRMCHYIFSQVLVKKLATINHYINESGGEKKSDFMTFLHTNIKYSYDSLIVNLSQKKSKNSENVLAVRNDMDTDINQTDENTETHLEQSSRISDQPADRSIFINYTAHLAVEKHLKRHNMSIPDYKKACAFYEKNIQHVSPLTNALVASYMGYCVGGAKGIRYLTLKNYIPLMVTTQLMLASRNFIDVVHLLTATSSPKTTPFTSIESSLQQNYKVSNEYIQCLTLYPYSLGKNKDNNTKIGIETQIDTIITWITQNDHHHKTAPSIQKYLAEDPAPDPNTPIQYEERVAANICSIILDHHQE